MRLPACFVQTRRLTALVGVAGLVWGAAAVVPTRAGAVVGPGVGGAPVAAVGAPYYVASPNGAVWALNGGHDYGSMGGQHLNLPIVGITLTPDAKGYWLVASDGGIFTFGDAAFYGSTGAVHLNQPIIGMTSTPDGKGYWLYAADGGIFSFGDARFYGSTGAVHLHQPIVGMTSSTDGKGYWLVAGDGGIFTFGDARFYGSMGGTTLNQPVIAVAAAPAGDGYWELAKDGGVFTFGRAAFYGSLGATAVGSHVLRMVSASDGRGYWLISNDAEVFPFGSAATHTMATTGLMFDVATQGDIAVVWALAQLGKPYLWGGTGPDNFDCSGLVMEAWQSAGVTLPRVAAAQYGAGINIPVADLQPGDLLFYASDPSNTATIYHVSMFLGGTKVVAAPSVGEFVRIEDFGGPDLVPMGTRP